MTLAAPAPMADALAPLLLPADLTLTAEQFAAVCQANPNAVLELDASGHVISMTPTGYAGTGTSQTSDCFSTVFGTTL